MQVSDKHIKKICNTKNPQLLEGPDEILHVMLNFIGIMGKCIETKQEGMKEYCYSSFIESS